MESVFIRVGGAQCDTSVPRITWLFLFPYKPQTICIFPLTTGFIHKTRSASVFLCVTVVSQTISFVSLVPCPHLCTALWPLFNNSDRRLKIVFTLFKALLRKSVVWGLYSHTLQRVVPLLLMSGLYVTSPKFQSFVVHRKQNTVPAVARWIMRLKMNAAT